MLAGNGAPLRLNENAKRLGPLTAVDHAALVHVCEHEKLIHRDDGFAVGLL